MITQDWKNATPEQMNLWNLCNGLIAWNTITPLYYCGAVAGSEFLVYAATKIYICLEFCVNKTAAASATVGQAQFYDVANAVFMFTQNNAIGWDTTAAAYKFMSNDSVVKNFYFSRLTVASYTNMKFNGYRLTIV